MTNGDSGFWTCLQTAKRAFGAGGGNLIVKAEPPATEDDVVRLEYDLGIALPPSYRTFLREANGLYITPNDNSTCVHLIAAPRVLAETRNFLADLFPPEHHLIVCGFGPEADWIVLNPVFRDGEEYAVLAGDHDDARAALMEFSIIARSFGEFFSRVLDNIAAGSELGALYWLTD